MYNESFFDLNPNKNFFSALHPKTKLGTMLFIALMSVVISSPKTLFLLNLSMLFLHILVRISFKRLKTLIILISISIWGTMISQGILYSQEPRTEIACLISPHFPVIGYLTQGVYLYNEGFLYGAAQGLRTSIMVLMGLLLCWNIDTKELLKVLESWHMPREIAFMVASGIRFLPIIAEETRTVIIAQKLKGIEVCKGINFRCCIDSAYHTLLPVLARVIRRSALLAVSVEARGFPPQRLKNNSTSIPLVEKGFLLFLLSLFIVVVICKTYSFLHINGLYYYSGLHEIYNIVNEWM
jgi:energy-coupling factor transport system permease protein